jgi:hypothetical protein
MELDFASLVKNEAVGSDIVRRLPYSWLKATKL